MTDGTDWTPSADDNLLGLSDRDAIDKREAEGVVRAEYFLFEREMDEEDTITVSLILDAHRMAFGKLYSWAGKWRTGDVQVGQLIPPSPERIPNLMYQFVSNLNHKCAGATSFDDHLEVLTWAHYEFVRIHPFTNGNGRTARLITNLIALRFGYRPLRLYHREGESRKNYIAAMRLADKGDFSGLAVLVREEMIPF